MKEILAALKPTLIQLFSSKRILVGMSAGIVQLIASVISILHIHGIEPDQAAIDRYVILVIAYIVGQSAIEHAKAKNAAPSDVTPSSSTAVQS